MRHQTKHTVFAILILLSSGLYFTLAYIGFKEQFIQLETLTKYNGQVIDRGITSRKSTKYQTTVFYVNILGLKETLGIYRMSGDYQGLVNELNPGDDITVYYIERVSNDINIDLVQIEKDGKIIVDADEYRGKESSLIYIGLIAGFLTVGGSFWYYKRYV